MVWQLLFVKYLGGRQHFHDACALQMVKKKRSAEQLATLAAVNDKKRRTVPEASSAAAPVDSGTDPPPAGRFRRSCRTPTAQVQSGRPLQLLPLLRTARWRLVEVMPQYVYQPHPPGSHAHAPQLSPSRCVHRCARTHAHPAPDCAGGAGCFGGFCCTDRALHVGRAAACHAGPAAVCLPLHPPAACARARSIAASIRPLSAARRCRSGCECQRC